MISPDELYDKLIPHAPHAKLRGRVEYDCPTAAQYKQLLEHICKHNAMCSPSERVAPRGIDNHGSLLIDVSDGRGIYPYCTSFVASDGGVITIEPIHGGYTVRYAAPK